MSQELLNKLALMTIESDLLDEVDGESVVNDFVTKHASRVTLLSEFVGIYLLFIIVHFRIRVSEK